MRTLVFNVYLLQFLPAATWAHTQVLVPPHVDQKRQKLKAGPTSAQPKFGGARGFRCIRGHSSVVLESVRSPLIRASAPTSVWLTLGSRRIFLPVLSRCETLPGLVMAPHSDSRSSKSDKNYCLLGIYHFLKYVGTSMCKHLSPGIFVQCSMRIKQSTISICI